MGISADSLRLDEDITWVAPTRREAVEISPFGLQRVALDEDISVSRTPGRPG